MPTPHPQVAPDSRPRQMPITRLPCAGGQLIALAVLLPIIHLNTLVK